MTIGVIEARVTTLRSFAAADRTSAIDTWSRALKAFEKQSAADKARAVQDKIDRARQVVKNTLDEAK